MKVRDVMTKNVFTATPDMSLKSAATRMLHYSVSGMPVVDGERVLGVISETDILFKERTAPDRWADLVRAFSREDHEIERELRDGIVRHFWMAPSRLRISVVEGSLILAGEVDSEELAEAVAAFAARTPGVVSVESRLRWPGKAGVSVGAGEPVTGA
jgi:hypothetical protein